MKNFKFLSLLLLFTLISCGKEQFGSTPTSESTNTSGVQAYENLTCALSTLVKPPVDIIYVVDNSTSTNYMHSSIKSAIQQTIGSVSNQFDYRIIGTPLISNNTNDFQILSNGDLQGFSGHKIINPNEFSFFSNTIATPNEPGFQRVRNFIGAHISSGLLRKKAHTIIVLISNGFDTDTTTQTGGVVMAQTNGTSFLNHLSEMKKFKSPAQLDAKQVRFMSVVSHQPSSSCSVDAKPGLTYKEMSRLMYLDSGATDNNSYQDSYDLCTSGFTNLFTGINSSIQQVLQPHKYNRWPVTLTSASLNTSDLKVYRVNGTTQTLMSPGTQWSLISQSSCGSPCNTRFEPTVGEPATTPNVIQFTSGNHITYPECVVLKGNDFTEYFGYIVINRAPDETKPIAIVINGQPMNSSDWVYVGYRTDQNIKVEYQGSPAIPAVNKSGYMFQIKNNKFYQSGDSVEVYYQPAGI